MHKYLTFLDEFPENLWDIRAYKSINSASQKSSYNHKKKDPNGKEISDASKWRAINDLNSRSEFFVKNELCIN